MIGERRKMRKWKMMEHPRTMTVDDKVAVEMFQLLVALCFLGILLPLPRPPTDNEMPKPDG